MRIYIIPSSHIFNMMNPLSLQGKHILVTGASSGMGKVFSKMIAAQGGKVTLLARNVERLNDTWKSLDGEGHQVCVCDLTDEEQLNAAVDGMGPVDGIVLCAGINEFVPVKFVKQEKIERMLHRDIVNAIRQSTA